MSKNIYLYGKDLEEYCLSKVINIFPSVDLIKARLIIKDKIQVYGPGDTNHIGKIIKWSLIQLQKN